MNRRQFFVGATAGVASLAVAKGADVGQPPEIPSVDQMPEIAFDHEGERIASAFAESHPVPEGYLMTKIRTSIVEKKRTCIPIPIKEKVTDSIVDPTWHIGMRSPRSRAKTEGCAEKLEVCGSPIPCASSEKDAGLISRLVELGMSADIRDVKFENEYKAIHHTIDGSKELHERIEADQIGYIQVDVTYLPLSQKVKSRDMAHLTTEDASFPQEKFISKKYLSANYGTLHRHVVVFMTESVDQNKETGEVSVKVEISIEKKPPQVVKLQEIPAEDTSDYPPLELLGTVYSCPVGFESYRPLIARTPTGCEYAMSGRRDPSVSIDSLNRALSGTRTTSHNGIERRYTLVDCSPFSLRHEDEGMVSIIIACDWK